MSILFYHQACLILLQGSTPIDAPDHQVPDERTHLAAIRTVLALDRTLLAWARTAISLMAAGVAFDKGARLFHEARVQAGTAFVNSSHAIGITVSAAGTVLIAVAIWGYLRDLRTVGEMLPKPPTRLQPSLFASLLVMALGVLATVVMILSGN